jgi:hypothetical protein
MADMSGVALPFIGMLALGTLGGAVAGVVWLCMFVEGRLGTLPAAIVGCAGCGFIAGCALAAMGVHL